MEYEASGVSLTYHNDTHPILKKPYLIYSLDLGPHKPENVHHDNPQTNKLWYESKLLKASDEYVKIQNLDHSS